MNKVAFTQLLQAYGESWQQLHNWGKLIRSPQFIDIVRLLHIVLMGNISSTLVDNHYIYTEFEKRYGSSGDDVEKILLLAVKEGLLKKTRGIYELTLHGRLFLFLISDILVEIATFYKTPPTKREIAHILRILSMLRVYESEGLVAENIGLLTTALSNIRKSAKFVLDSGGEDLYERLVEEYESIKSLASRMSDDEDFTKALTALAGIIDTELTFIREHLEEIRHLRRKSYLLLYASSHDVERIRDKLLENVDIYFDFSLIPIAGLFTPVSYIRRYMPQSREDDIVQREVSITYDEEASVVMPTSDELFQVLFAYYKKNDELPNMSEDTWWLDRLNIYKDSYMAQRNDIGYIRAIKARKVMALSMFLMAAMSDEHMKASIKQKGESYFRAAYQRALNSHVL